MGGSEMLSLIRNSSRLFTTKRAPLSLTQALKEKDVLVVDVRSPEEVTAGGTCPGAINIPVDTVPANKAILGTDPSRPIVFYCKKGIRAANAASFIQQLGFYNSFSVTDGPSTQTLIENARRHPEK